MNQNIKYIILAIICLLVPYTIGLFMDLMDVDATQYATMARQMMESESYLKIYDREDNYLDKPPLVFWTAALSYKIFGVSNFSYRLPSFIFTLLGLFATYRFSILYYNKNVATIAVLMVASCQGFILFNHDVRTDTLQTGATIATVWLLAAYLKTKKLKYFIGTFVAIGLAMLAKGMLGLMIPVLAFATHFILKREWKQFFRLEWLVGIVIVGLVLLPMCVGLYKQYGNDGLYFFFWKQSFGRITGENDWKNDADIFFFTHTFLWSFLPWSFLFLPAFYNRIKLLITSKFKLKNNEEAITFAGFLLPYLALSTSKYQLPHYIFILFPFAAIITADYLYQKFTKSTPKGIWITQIIVVGILWLLTGTLVFWCFEMTNVLLWIVLILYVLLSIFFLFNPKFNYFNKIIIASVITISGVNFILNSHVYPSLFPYQSEMQVARYVLTLPKQEQQTFHWYKTYLQSLDLYSRRIIPTIDLYTINNSPNGKQFLIYTNQIYLKDLKSFQNNIEIVKEYNDFHISTLSPEFLNPNTRQKQTERTYLIRLTVQK